MSNPVALSLVDLTAALHAKKLSPVELMGAVLARIEATNPSLNAVVALHDRGELMAQAARPRRASRAAKGARSKACRSA